MSIELKNITKKYGTYTALDDINLTVGDGELVALLGPSGCGKTTLLRTIAGLETPDSGQILLEGRDTADLPIRHRNVGFVFQHYALFRHMSVFENVAFAMKVLKGKDRPSKQVIKERVTELLTLVQMDWAADRYPAQLSGGQRQRIALARALAVRPRVLLLDEPFSALDAKVRSELRRWLRRLHDEIHVTSLFVTHDQEEALELADRIVIVNKGRIEQTGTPEEVYDHPANPFVHNFLGSVNVFHLRIQDGKPVVGPEGHPDNLKGFVRPHEVILTRERDNSDQIIAEILEIRLMGSLVGLELAGAGVEGIIEAEIPRSQWKALGLGRGDQVFLTLHNIKVYTGGSYVI